jgi:hypothetical protein
MVPKLQLIGPELGLEAAAVPVVPVDDDDVLELVILFEAGTEDVVVPAEVAAVPVLPLGKQVTLTLCWLLLELSPIGVNCRVPRLQTIVPAGKPLAAAVEVCPLADELGALNGTPVACVSKFGFAANCSNVVPLSDEEEDCC